MRYLLPLLLLLAALPLCAQLPTVQRCGLNLEALSAEDLDILANAVGRRIGVLVLDVVPGSAAAKAGLRKGDVILAFGQGGVLGVDSPEATEKALAGKVGPIPVGAIRFAGEDVTMVPCTLDIPAAAAAPPTQPAGVNPRYRDPRAGFEFEHLADWAILAYPNGMGVAVTQGDAMASVMLVAKATDAGRVIGDTGAQMAKQWKNWKADWGTAPMQGADAPLVRFSGTNPKGVRAKGLMTACVANGMGYLLLGTGPEGGFAQVEAAWTLLVKTFTAGQASATLRDGAVFRHPIGFSFWYPKGWSVKETNGMLQLVPPDAAMANGQAAELYLLTGAPLAGAGITAPDDPRVLALLNQQVQQLSPALLRTGDMKPVSMANGKGIMLDWSAPGRDGGNVIARAFAGIIKDSGIMLLGLGAQMQIEGRSADMQAMFASFGLTDGKVDPQLAGVWRMTSTYALSNEAGYRAGYETQWSKAKAVTEDQISMQLGPDGAFVRREVGRTIVGAGTVWLDSGNQETVRRGRWYAEGGMAYFIGDDGKSESYQYKLEVAPNGRRTATLASGRVAEVWQQ